MTSSHTSYYLKSMMVNISINIKFRKEFKCLLMTLMLRQGGMIVKNRHKMCSSEDGVKMNHRSYWLTSGKMIWFNNIHASDITGCVSYVREPMH